MLTFSTQLIVLSEDKRTSTIQILKVGKVSDRNMNITDQMLSDIVTNFKSGAYGSDIQVNLGHNRDGEAAGWLRDLYVKDRVLFAEVEWTPLGLEKIESKQFKYTSSEISLSAIHFKNQTKVKNVLIGVALTNIPAVKGMEPVALSENMQLFFNENTMEDLQKMYDEMMGKEACSAEDIMAFENAMKAMMETGWEQTEEVGKMLEELRGKIKAEDAPKEEMKAEEVPAEDKPVEPAPEAMSEKTVKLSEYEKLQEEKAALEKQILLSELDKQIDESFMLSDTQKIGFRDSDKEKVVAFMESLTAEQREEFSNLFANIQAVELSTIGSENTAKTVELSDDAVVDLAGKLFKEGKAKSMGEAQKMAIAQLSEGK